MDLNRLEQMWPSHTAAEIAKELGVPRQKVYRTARAIGLEPKGQCREPGAVDPSEEEIQALTKLIREGWSDEEERSRRQVGRRREWTLREVQFSDFAFNDV